MGEVAPGGGSAARPFVGRAAERALLRHLVRDAGDGRTAMVVVSGAPGAGKTALLEWAASAAERAGAEVLRASGYESSLPFAALRRLLAPFPELGDALYEPDGGLVRLLVDALAARARRRPLAVLLDDVQDLGDASSTVLVDTLLGLDDEGTRSPLHLFVLLTTRQPIEADGPADRVLRLAAARSLTVEGFDERDVFELLAATGPRPRPGLVRELLEDTGGLPLLIESELERRRSPPGPGDARVHTISDALDRRFDKVDPATRDLLTQAAVLGEPWSTDELALVLDRPRSEIEAMTDAAEEARLVTGGRGGVRFAHPLVRSALLDSLGLDRRRALHRSVAERLRAVHGSRGSAGDEVGDGVGDEVAVRIADHLLRAGPEVPPGDVAETALAAGRIAMGWTAWGQASRFLTAAAEAADAADPALDPGTSARRYLEAGRAAYFDYDSELADTLFARAITRAEQAGDDCTRLTAAMLVARMRGGRSFRPGDRLDVSELDKVMRSDLRVPAALRVEATAALAEGLIVSGESDAALDLVESARRVAAGASPDQAIDDALGRVGFAEGIHRLTRLELSAADACFAAGLRHAVAAGNLLNQCLARSRRALGGLMRGDVGASYAELAAVEEQEVAAGFWGEVGLTAAQMGFADVLAGRPEAEERLDQAHRQWRRTGFPWNEVLLSAALAALTSRSGQSRDRDRRQAAGSGSGPGHRPELPVTSAVAALSAVEAYDVPRARAVLETARWRHGFQGPVTMNNATIAVALVEVGDLVGNGALVRAAAPALERLYERGALVALSWPVTIPRLLAVVARHAGEPDRARRYLDHARGLADREDLAPERAKILLELARLSGDRDPAQAESALASAVRAFDEQSMHGWVARCDAVAQEMRLPALVGVTGVSRERTIFTDDVVGSTAANARLGDPLYLEQLRVHDRLVRGRLAEFRGAEIKHTGDGVNAVFDEPADAVRCALAVMADFREWNQQEPDLALEIRCGLARGPVIPSSGDFYGLVQSEAARLCSLATAGEILASAAVVGACGPGVAAESLGLHELRGFPSPIEVFRLAR